MYVIPLPILMNKTLYKGVFRAIIGKKCERGVNKERIGSKIERKASFLFAVLIMFAVLTIASESQSDRTWPPIGMFHLSFTVSSYEKKNEWQYV